MKARNHTTTSLPQNLDVATTSASLLFFLREGMEGNDGAGIRKGQHKVSSDLSCPL